MTTTTQADRTQSRYERFYGRGGWSYNAKAERRRLSRLVVEPGGWEAGDHVVEVGAGMGQHAELLRRLGFQVTAVELARSGARYAKRKFPKLNVVCVDVSQWEPPQPVDHVFARGMSYFHYELLGINKRGVDVPAQTRRMFGWLRPGGTFALQIATDFSGRKRSVHYNRLEDYVELFSPLGEIIALHDWRGRALTPGSPPRGRRGIVIITRHRG